MGIKEEAERVNKYLDENMPDFNDVTLEQFEEILHGARVFNIMLVFHWLDANNAPKIFDKYTLRWDMKRRGFNLESTEESREEAKMILDYHIGSEYEGEMDLNYFIRWFEKGIKIDPEYPFEWMKENLDRFDERMLNYARSRAKDRGKEL